MFAFQTENSGREFYSSAKNNFRSDRLVLQTI